MLANFIMKQSIHSFRRVLAIVAFFSLFAGCSLPHKPSAQNNAEATAQTNTANRPISINPGLLTTNTEVIAQTNTATTIQTNAPPALQTNTIDPALVAKLAQLGRRPNGVHDPSTIVKCKDEFWVFYTGRGTPSWHSKDLITWQAGPPIFTSTPSWVTNAVRNFRGANFWAPDVTFFNGRYLLYYSASSFGKNTSGIGLVTNLTLDPNDPNYHWTDCGMVVMSRTNDDFNTIDPAIAKDADGGLWLAFGSFWSGIKLIQLDPATGKRISDDSPMYSLAHYSSIEASFIYYHEGYYYLFVDWGMCCRGVRSTYNMRIGRSPKITGPYLDKEGKDMLTGGGTLLLDTDGPFIGPGHAGILEDGGKFWLSMHFYNGTLRGRSELAIRPLKWAADGWPEVGINEAAP